MSAAEPVTPALTRKLGIGEGDRVGNFGAPRELSRPACPLPAGVTVIRAPRRTCEVTVSYAKARHDLGRRLELASRVLPAAGGPWPAWPNRASVVVTDLEFAFGLRLGLEAGLVDHQAVRHR